MGPFLGEVHSRIRKAKHVWFLALLLSPSLTAMAAAPSPQPIQPGEELLLTEAEIGRYGGRLVVTLRSEPKTFNPVTAVDAPSREVLWRLFADLIHINRHSQITEPALAKSWKVSSDGLRYTLEVRRGLRFSDGDPLDADDVVFSFQVYLDEEVHSPQRDLLIVGGKPIAVRKLGPYTVVFELAKPYAAAERLFDSLAILPRHRLLAAYQQGKLAQAWGLNTPPAEIPGLGPFRLREYVPGQHIILERNPYYWKMDRKKNRLPYLDEIAFLVVVSEDAQALRFRAGEADVSSRMSAENFAVLEKESGARGYRLYDLGPGLEYNFLFFNLNTALPKDAADLIHKQTWFRQTTFRQAVSAAIDRAGIVSLVYRGRAAPLWTHVTPAHKLWINAAIPQPPRSVARARALLQSAGFSWKTDGTLLDTSGKLVEFSVVASASNAQRTQMATIIQDDLKEVGIQVHVVPMEFRAVLNRVFDTHDYEAALLGLVSGDVDPNPEMNVWLSTGGSHLWHLDQTQPATPWEAEIDELMKRQLTTLKFEDRKRLYDRVQQLVDEHLPLICLASPHILVGAKTRIGNFQPAILEPYTLWNVEQLFFRPR